MEPTNEQIESLRSFVLDILGELPDLTLDGGDLEDIATKHKLLIPQIVHAPCCDEGCSCSEFYSEEDFADGVTCYRIATWLERDAEQRNAADAPGQDGAFWKCPNCDYVESTQWQNCSRCGSPRPNRPVRG